jgi:exocyst complex component 2
VLLNSKAFDPKVFLSNVHPNATFKDLNVGRERLKDSLEQRSGALKMLVQAEWDRFVAVKSATESAFISFEGGLPIRLLTISVFQLYMTRCSRDRWRQKKTTASNQCETSSSVRLSSLRALTSTHLVVTEAQMRADTVFMPILDARTKAERLKSTLGVFERSKFFFNLPGILGEAVEAVRSELVLTIERER